MLLYILLIIALCCLFVLFCVIVYCCVDLIVCFCFALVWFCCFGDSGLFVVFFILLCCCLLHCVWVFGWVGSVWLLFVCILLFTGSFALFGDFGILLVDDLIVVVFVTCLLIDFKLCLFCLVITVVWLLICGTMFGCTSV